MDASSQVPDYEPKATPLELAFGRFWSMLYADNRLPACGRNTIGTPPELKQATLGPNRSNHQIFRFRLT